MQMTEKKTFKLRFAQRNAFSWKVLIQSHKVQEVWATNTDFVYWYLTFQILVQCIFVILWSTVEC